MEVAEQQREWQKEEVEEEEEEAALEVRRPRNLSDETPPFSHPVSEPEEVEHRQEELQYDSNGNTDERTVFELRKPAEAGAASGEEMLGSVGESNEVNKLRKTETGGGYGEEEMRTTSGPVYEFQDEEEEEECRQEELRVGIEVEPDVLQKLEKNVYYDQDQGMWKCRNCCWTYQSGCPGIDHTQHYNSHIHMLVNPKSVNQWGQCFFCETEGTETFSGYSATDTSSVRGFASENFFGDDESVATLTKVESQRDDNFAGFRLQPSEKSSEGHRTNKSLTDITETHDEIQLIKETDDELIEFDVERVLEKQDTHDLYCPNCHSCITRRVILRKRKRISVDDPKRYKLETVVASELHATKEADISLDASMEPAADEYDHVREPEIFRCLQCFSCFIPSGEGFTLFKIFGDTSVKERIQSPQPIPVVKKNWLLSIFASRKEEMSSEQGSSRKTYLEENIVVQSSTAKHENGSIVPPSAEGLKLAGEPTAGDIIEKGAGAAVEDSKLQKPVPVGSDISGEANILPDFPAEKGEIAGATLSISSVIESRNVEIKIVRNGTAYPTEVSQPSTNGTKVDIYKEETFKSDKAHKAALSLPAQDAQLLQDPQAKAHKGALSLPVQDAQLLQDPQAKAHKDALSLPVLDAQLLQDPQAKADKGALSLPVQDAQLLQDTPANITKDPAKSSASPDTRITIEGPVEPTSSQEATDISTSPETVPLLRPQSAEARESQGLEIIKSIVYGGLMESITSLGIVSSAAGADASTVNILALGVANLIGGLFVIGHHLWDLKDDHPMETSNQVTTQKNRYQELLGRRQNFWLHATVAILSFLIFGLVPPVVYGFAFRVSDDVDYKLIAVAGASLLCIILLAIAKVYVQTQRTAKAYLKTITYYVVMGFMASGVSYAVGDLIKILLAKLGWFDSTQTLTFPTPGVTTPVESAWGSY